MQIKVLCQCGQKYAFDIEPVNGLMPAPVNCPVCGADGTAAANQIIQQTLAASQPVVAASAPVPAAPGKLRISHSAPAPEPAPTAPAILGTAPAAPATPAAGYTRSRAYQPAAPETELKENVPMGLVGGVVAGVLAAAGWYFLSVSTNHEFGYAAWFVGVMTGGGVRLLARNGGPKLGYIAALCAALAILGGKFLVANSISNEIEGGVASVVQAKYEAELTVAKSAVKANTDQEITAWLEDNGNGPANPQRIEKFRAEDQPKMQDFINGKPSKAEFVKKLTDETTKQVAEFGAALGVKLGSRFEIFKDSVDLFTILWLIFGVISAWRIGTG